MKVDIGSYDPDTGWIGDFYCPNCNRHLSPTKRFDVKFCWMCGIELDWNVSIDEIE
jgi:predicted amidophosphoribosyltransferase